MLFPPAVIDDFKRRLAGLEIISATSPPPAPDPLIGMDLEDSTYASPSDSPAPPPPPSEGGFKSAFRAAPFAPAAPEDAEVEGEGEEVYDDGVDGDAAVMDDLDGAAASLDDVEVDGAVLLEEDIDGAVAVLDEHLSGEGGTAETDGGQGEQLETVVIDDEDGEAMEIGSDEDDIFSQSN
jgi:hypothetical protein